MSRRYPKDFHDFMREYVPGHTAVEISEEVKRRLNIEISPSAVKSYKTNNKLKSGTPTGLPKGHPSDQFPQYIKDYIVKHHKGVGPTEMAEKLNKRFETSYTARQLNAYYKNHGIKSGLTGKFEKGHIPLNKGKKIENVHPNSAATQFKAGHKPHNKMPIGSIIMKADGYMYQKIGEGARDWKQKHLLVWEEANGPVPEGYVLNFKDGNRENYTLENLALLSKAEHLELTRLGLRSTNPDLTETGILIAKVKCAEREKTKQIRRQGAKNA